MGMASDLLERLSEDLEVLSLHTRAYLDEFGTLLCYLEGGRGGGTTLLHAPYTEALPVLQAGQQRVEALDRPAHLLI